MTQPEQCSASVYVADGSLMGWNRPCKRRATVQEGGRWWCPQHSSSRQAARRTKVEAQWERKRAELRNQAAKDQEMRHQAEVFPGLIAAARQTLALMESTIVIEAGQNVVTQAQWEQSKRALRAAIAAYEDRT